MSEDVVIRITGQDAGGKALVDQLTQSIDKSTAAVKSSGDALSRHASNSKQAGDAAEKTGSSVRKLSEGMELIVTAIAAQKLLEFAKSGIEAQLQISRLSKETGASVEGLSILGLAAQETGGDTNDLAQAFRGLSRSQAEAQAGNGQIAEAYKAIGLSVSDLAGLKPDELFKKVADAQANYSDGLGKSAALQQIFGRSAQTLLPTLNAVAGEGLANVTARAKELGIVLDQDAAERAEKLEAQMVDLKASLTGVAEQVSEHLVPGITDLAHGLTGLIATAPDGVKRVADYVVAIAAAATAVSVAVKVIGGGLALISEATPIGLAVTALVGLATILGVVYEHEKQSQIAQLDAVRTSADQAVKVNALTKEYEREVRALDSGKLSASQAEAAKEKLKKITQELRDLSPDYAKALGDESAGYDAVAASLKKLNDERQTALELQAKQLSIALAQAESDLADAQRPQTKMRSVTGTGPGGAGLAPGALSEVPSPNAGSDVIDAAKQRVAVLQAQLAAALGGVVAGDGTNGTKPNVVIPDLNLAKAQIAALVAEIQADIQRVQDAEKAAQDANAAAYARGTEDLTTYYERRAQIIQQGADKEATDLEAERATILQTPTSTPAEALQVQTAAQAVADKITKLRTETSQQLAQLGEDERKAGIQLAADVGSAEASVYTATGNTVAAMRTRIDSEVAKVVETLAKIPGIGVTGANRVGDQLRDALNASADFAKLQQDADRALADIANQKQQIDALHTAGTIGDDEAESRTIALERERLPLLQQIGAQMEQIAHDANNPELIRQADAFNASLSTMGVKLDLAAQAWANFKSDVQNALENDLIQFLGSTINTAHSVGDAFRQLALSAVQSIQQIIARLIVLDGIKLAKKALGIDDDTSTAKTVVAAAAMGTAGIAVQDGGDRVLAGAAALLVAAQALSAAQGFGFLGFAGGGVIDGPGTGTSDSILARVSAGEGILTANTVRRISPAAVHQLNAGAPLINLRDFSHLRVPHFAGGGVVGSDGTTAGLLSAMAGGSGTSRSELHIGLDHGLIEQYLDSPEGTKVVLKHIARNPKKIKGMLGITSQGR